MSNISNLRRELEAKERELIVQTANANALKIVLNSTFGKMNDAYSPLRSIPNAMRVTINGQLQILMLVEALTLMGARVLSANTDGVTLMWHRDRMADLQKAKKAWEVQTGHALEEVEYAHYLRRDVNNYLAQYANGKVKTKGIFELIPLAGGKSDNRIAKIAAAKWLIDGTPVRETVEASLDVKDFIFYARVKNGGDIYHGRKPVGRTFRWLITTDGKDVERCNPDGTFDHLPNGYSAVDARELPVKLPANLDRSYYIGAAVDILNAITKRKKSRGG